MELTTKQQAILKDMSQESGYNNGHVFYMVTGLSDDQVGQLLEYLDEKEKTDFYCFVEFVIEKSKLGNTVKFDSHEKYYSEVADEISAMFPGSIVYWNDCWDYEGTMMVSLNGGMVEPKKVCYVKLEDDNETDDEEYFETTAIVTDIRTGSNFEIGGGYIYMDERESILELVKETRKNKIA